MNLRLTEDEDLIVATVREFVEAELRGNARELDEEARVPIEVIRRMQELGFFGLMIPEEYGGVGVSAACYVAVIEEI